MVKDDKQGEKAKTKEQKQKEELSEEALKLWLESELTESINDVTQRYLSSNPFGHNNLLQKNQTLMSELFETAKSLINIKYHFKGQKYIDFFNKVFRVYHDDLLGYFQ